MKIPTIQEPIILAVYPGTRGFGFAVFEGMDMVVDWGMKTTDAENRHERRVNQFKQLVDWFHPHIVLLQDCSCKLLRCSRCVIEAVQEMADLVTAENITLRQYTRMNIRECFGIQYDAINRNEIAQVIAERFAEFSPRLPPARKLWKEESHNMPIFDTVSLVFSYFYFEYLKQHAI